MKISSNIEARWINQAGEMHLEISDTTNRSRPGELVVLNVREARMLAALIHIEADGKKREGERL